MRTSQWEPRLAVVVNAPRPLGRGMANRAIRREGGLGVVRVLRAVVGCQVTGGALCRRSWELVVSVAAKTIQAGVGPGQ